MALTGLALAAALALAKDQLVDQPAAKRKRKLAATTQRLSPWTGLKADVPDDPNTIGNMMAWGATGAQMGAGMESQAKDMALKDQMIKNMKANPYQRMNMNVNTGSGGGNPWSGGGQWDWNSNPYAT